MHYCDHALSVVRPSVVRRPSVVVNFSHFRLFLWNHWTEFDETLQESRSQCPLPSLCFSGRSEKQDDRPRLWFAETFSTSPLKLQNGIQRNLTGNKISTSSTKFVFFGPIGKNKMAALASDWLRHFRLLLWNRWTEFNEIWQEARSQRPLPSLCFSGRSEKHEGRPGFWLAETFSTSPLKPLNGIQRNLTGSKISMSSTNFYQVCVFRADRKNKMAALASDWLRHFRLLLWNRWTEFNETWQEARSPCRYQVCVFRADRKNKMAALASDCLRHYRLLLWNRWTEFNETWQEARSQRYLPSLCFSGRSDKQDGRPGLWLSETFSTSPLKPLNGIQRNLTGSKISMPLPSLCVSGRSEKQDGRPGLWLSETLQTFPLKPLNGIQRNLTGSKISTSSTKFVFFGPIEKTRWPPWPLIVWDISDFSSATAERNSTKLDRKQDLNVLYQVCVFRADQKKKTRWPPWPLIGWDIFDFSSETAERNSTKLDRKQDLIVLYQVCVFRADRKNKMTALAFDCLRHFRLLLWNRWTEFNETWQEARFQRPLPSLCFSGRSVKQDGHPGLWLAETFSTSPLKPLNGIQRNLTGSKISTFSTKFVFFGPIRKTRWPPWPLIVWDISDFSSETAEQNSTKLDRKQDLNVLYQVCVFRADRKNKMAALASDCLRHFRLLLWNRWTEFNET